MSVTIEYYYILPFSLDAVNNGTCKFGSPLRIPGSRKEVFCGRGPNRQECPSSHACNVSSNGNAVCCPKDGKSKYRSSIRSMMANC